MKSVSLLGVFILAKILVLSGRDSPWSPWMVVAFLWQDLLIVLCFAYLESKLRHQGFLWSVYGVISVYVAVNVPVMALFSTPLTWPMIRAARGALADSVQHHLIWENIRSIALIVLGAAGFPILAKRLRVGSHWIAYALASGLVALGPFVTAQVETGGVHRNALFALVASSFPRIKARQATDDWRTTPFTPKTGLEVAAHLNACGNSVLEFSGRSMEDLIEFRGVAAGRNVILILLESTGAEYLRCYGAAEDPTPNLTTLAKECILAENAYAVYPESIKGLFSVLCSRYPAFDTAPELYACVKAPSIAGMLHESGYRTALFHSGRFDYLGMESIIENRGFEILEDAGAIGGNHRSSFGVDERSTVHRILRWIDSLPCEERFFITYLPIAGHHPYDSPEAGPFRATDDLGGYRNALHYGDAALGELIGELRKRTLYEKTVFVLVGDHGEAFGQHEGNFGHTLFVYEENVRVPCLIVAPGLFKQQTRFKPAISLIDIAPTILDLLGLQAPAEFDGRSLLEGSGQMVLFYTDYSLGLLGLRDGKWKFIYELDSGRSKLFDLHRDPHEGTNLAPDEPDRMEIYRDRLLRWSAAQREKVLRSRHAGR